MRSDKPRKKKNSLFFYRFKSDFAGVRSCGNLFRAVFCRKFAEAGCLERI